MDVFYNKLEPSEAISGMDVVGGRLDMVSAVSLNWAFQNSNQIRLVNPTTGRWELVKCATEPTLLNNADDMNGTALVPSTIYDVFAEYSSSTAFNLVLSRWATGGDGANNSSTSYATPVMTANNAPGPVNCYSDSSFSSDFYPYKIFTQTNSSDTDAWNSSDTAHPHWVAVDFGQPVCVNKFAFQTRNHSTEAYNKHPKQFKLQGSNNSTNGSDGTWDDLHTEYSSTPLADINYNTWSSYFTFKNSLSYKSYRLYVTASKNAGNACNIGELKLVAASNSIAGSSSRVRVYESTVTYNIGDRVTYGGHDWVKQSSAAAGTTPVAGVNWVDNGTSVSGDFAGLYRHDGVLVSDSSDAGKSRRWLGIIYTYNNSGTVNFKDDVNYRYVSNFYNTKQTYANTVESSASWTYATNTFREANNGSGVTRANIVTCVDQIVTTAFTRRISGSGVTATVGVDINWTSSLIQAYKNHLTVTVTGDLRMSLAGQAVIYQGYNYMTTIETAASGTVTFYGTADGWISSALFLEY